MTNQEISRLLKSVAAAYTVKAENRFRIAAYNEAGNSIEHATSEIKDLWDEGKLHKIPGVGKNIASYLDELFRTGKVRHFEKVFKGLPPAMFVFLDIPGIGPKSALKLCQKLKINRENNAINKLENAGKDCRIALIEGFGKKSQADILSGIKAFKKGQTKENRMALSYAAKLAQEIIDYLKKSSGCLEIELLGSLRRKVATVGDIDLAVSTKNPQKVIDWFCAYSKIDRVVEKGTSEASIKLKNGQQVDLRVQSPAAFGAMLQYFTGNKQHNIHLREIALKRGLSLSEYGIKQIRNPCLAGRQAKSEILKYKTEKDFYGAVGMDYIPPELREDMGEIEASIKHKLPKLVNLNQIKGDLHLHSNFPIEESHDPGMSSMTEMIKKAETLGYQYLGFAEHNPSQSKHSENQILDLIKTKKEAIDKLLYSRTNKLLIKVFNGLEIDINPSGELALPEKAFAFLDYGIASIHSSFDLPKTRMTERILRALTHPKIKIFGHPTGRIIGRREGYEFDWEKVFSFCLKNHKWLEINAYPDRLDLPDNLVREAVKKGVKMIINTDSHLVDQMGLMNFGVSVAQRGWAEESDIVNCLDCDRMEKMLKGGEK